MSPPGRQSLPRPKTQPFKTASIGIQNHERKSCANFAADCMIASTAEIDGFPGTLKPCATHGRKFEHEWQIETYRASRQLNHPRLIIDWLPPWLHSRFKHRLRSAMVD